jgi:hypothetical protein
MDPVSSIARALLYEGYILWPYRRSALKNRQRWTLGGVYPPAYAAESGGADRAMIRAQCLAQATNETRLGVSVRFLQVVARQVLRATADGLAEVDELEVDAERFLTWDETVEREVSVSLTLASAATAVQVPIDIDSGSFREELRTATGVIAGAIERRWEALAGIVSVDAQQTEVMGVQRVTVCIANSSPLPKVDRGSAVRRAFVSAHVAFHIEHGSFVSLLDPPPHLADLAVQCEREGLWPVLVGEEASTDTMLASPIILYDYPRIAPESPGDLFDGGEIDQLLILNVLGMTEEEQREMRDTDPKAREILERCLSLSTSELSALHGAIRSLRPLRRGEELQ